MDEQTCQTECIVITAADAPLDDALRGQLEQRRRAIRPFKDAFHGFAQLCLAERLQSSRSAWGLERAAAPMLILAAPLQETVQSDLLAARDRYLSSIPVYLWQSGALRELRAPAAVPSNPNGRETSGSVAGADAPDERDAPIMQPSPGSNRPHHLRLTEPMQPSERMADQAPRDANALGDDESDADVDDPDRPASLSAEEVQMLLGTEEGPSNR